MGDVRSGSSRGVSGALLIMVSSLLMVWSQGSRVRKGRSATRKKQRSNIRLGFFWDLVKECWARTGVMEGWFATMGEGAVDAS